MMNDMWTGRGILLALILGGTALDLRAEALTDALEELRIARNYKVLQIAPELTFNQQDEDGKKLELAPTYEDLIEQYLAESPTDPAEPPRTPRQLFRDSIQNFLVALDENPGSRVAREGLRDALAEYIEGQSLIGNDALVQALRARFPRLDSEGNSLEDLEPDALLELSSHRFELAMDELATVLIRYPDLFRAEGVEPPLEFVENSRGDLVPAELYVAMGALERKVRTRVERGIRAFRESALDTETASEVAENRELAAQRLRQAGHEAYLGLAVLASLHPDPESATRNLSGEIRARLFTAERVFDSIRAGENPRGYVKDFVPSRPSVTRIVNGKQILGLYEEAVTKVVQANADENTARIATRNYDQSLVSLKNELDAQRLGYRNPLESLSGLSVNLDGTIQKPDGTDLEININDEEGQEEFIAYLERQVQLNVRQLIQEFLDSGRLSRDQVDLENLPEIVPGEDITPIGEIGVLILELKAANIALVDAVEVVKSYPERIRIEQERVGRIARVTFRNARNVGALQVAMGFANFLESVVTTQGGVIKRWGSIVSGFLNARITDLQAELQVSIQDANSEATIKNLLIDQQRALLGVAAAEVRVVQARGVLDNMLVRARRLVEDWGQTRVDAAERFFKYPLFRVESHQSIQRAERSFNRALEACYLAAKALEYEWGETFANPVSDPAGGGGVSLPEGYDRFTRIDSLFGVRDTVELADFLQALYEWHKALSEGLRGNGRDETTQFSLLISLREDLLGFDHDLRADDQTSDEIQKRNLELFRQFVDRHRVPGSQDPEVDDLLFEFSTEIDSANLFPVDQWNQKIIRVGLSLSGRDLGATNPVVKLTQGGVASIRRYPVTQQNINRLSLQGLGPESLQDAFNNPAEQRTFTEVEAHIDASRDTFRTDPIGKMSGGLVELSVAANRWTFHLDRSSKPENRGFPLEDLTDIGIIFEYAYNHPSPEVLSSLQELQDTLGDVQHVMPQSAAR